MLDPLWAWFGSFHHRQLVYCALRYPCLTDKGQFFQALPCKVVFYKSVKTEKRSLDARLHSADVHWLKDGLDSSSQDVFFFNVCISLCGLTFHLTHIHWKVFTALVFFSTGFAERSTRHCANKEAVCPLKHPIKTTWDEGSRKIPRTCFY